MRLDREQSCCRAAVCYDSGNIVDPAPDALEGRLSVAVDGALRALRRRFDIAWHNRRIGGVERTRPLAATRSGLMYLSMVCHRDARACLVALKSVAAQLGAGSYTLIDDGTLTARDRDLLARHLGARLLRAGDIDTEGCPRGGTWERLLTALDLTRGDYVVQVDADVVALGPLPEVAAAVAANTAFTLGGEATARLTSAADAAASAMRAGHDHVQWDAERLLADLPGGGGLRYVRGCSGFAGFPRGLDGRARACALSGFMRSRLGRRWCDWGSEQVASNFVVANSGDPLLLPWPRYAGHDGGPVPADAALVHFMGVRRYAGGAFTAASRRAIASLPRH
jgi:hypothetical protein